MKVLDSKVFMYKHLVSKTSIQHLSQNKYCSVPADREVEILMSRSMVYLLPFLSWWGTMVQPLEAPWMSTSLPKERNLFRLPSFPTVNRLQKPYNWLDQNSSQGSATQLSLIKSSYALTLSTVSSILHPIILKRLKQITHTSNLLCDCLIYTLHPTTFLLCASFIHITK